MLQDVYSEKNIESNNSLENALSLFSHLLVYQMISA